MKKLMLYTLTALFFSLSAPAMALGAANCTQTPDATPLKATDDASNSPSSIVHKACDYGASFFGCGNKEQKLDGGCDSGQGSFISVIVNLFLYVSGIIAFIYVIIGGVRYISSTGDPGRIQSAKDTLLYAIIGLVVTALAIPISGFVIKSIAGS